MPLEEGLLNLALGSAFLDAGLPGCCSRTIDYNMKFLKRSRVGSWNGPERRKSRIMYRTSLQFARRRDVARLSAATFQLAAVDFRCNREGLPGYLPAPVRELIRTKVQRITAQPIPTIRSETLTTWVPAGCADGNQINELRASKHMAAPTQ